MSCVACVSGACVRACVSSPYGLKPYFMVYVSTNATCLVNESLLNKTTFRACSLACSLDSAINVGYPVLCACRMCTPQGTCSVF